MYSWNQTSPFNLNVIKNEILLILIVIVLGFYNGDFINRHISRKFWVKMFPHINVWCVWVGQKQGQRNHISSHPSKIFLALATLSYFLPNRSKYQPPPLPALVLTKNVKQLRERGLISGRVDV